MGEGESGHVLIGSLLLAKIPLGLSSSCVNEDDSLDVDW